jgi:hypothetical protein
MKDAEQLCTRLPGTLDALMSGSISCLQARAVTEASYVIDAGLLPEFEARVLKRAGEQTLAQLKQSIRRAVIRLDPASAEERRQRATTDRNIRVADAGDGMTWLAMLPIDQAKACYSRADAIARTAGKDDPRTMDQLRADAVVAAIRTGGSEGGAGLPKRHGLAPSISVIVSLETLAGVEDEPGWLDTYGPITAQHARDIASDPTGTTRYRPPKHLTELPTSREVWASCRPRRPRQRTPRSVNSPTRTHLTLRLQSQPVRGLWRSPAAARSGHDPRPRRRRRRLP